MIHIYLTRILYHFFLGVLLKKNDIIFFFKYNYLIPINLYLKYNSIYKSQALMDICVVDNIGDLSRFELTYSLILKTNRIFLKTTISSRKFILSLSGIYASAI
jgi:hypothetical protein